MQTWRRAFTTSITRLNHSPSSTSALGTRPILLRCAKLLQESGRNEDQEIRLQGLVRNVRKQKKMAFVEVSDGSTIQPVHALMKPDFAVDLSIGAAIEISGVWKASPPDKKQTHELHATNVNLVGAAEPETYPIQKKYHTPDFLRQIPHLRMRIPSNSLLSRLRSECIYQLGNVFRSHPDGAFVQVQPPLITSSDCEGAGETFTLAPREAVGASLEGDHFFRAPKYLTVSSQLHLEAYAAELGSVWALSPTFRAEKSDTPRHLSEFYMLEAEMNFMYDMPSLTNSVEHIIRDLTRRLYESPVGQEILSNKRPEESEQQEGTDTDAGSSLQRRWLGLIEGPAWRRMTYTKAIEALQDAVNTKSVQFQHPPNWADGLQLEHEKYIVDVICEGRPVFVTDYPKAVKPFYMAPSQSDDDSRSSPDRETVACFDLLFPEVSEVAGGSLREHRLENIIENMRESGLIKQSAAVTDNPDADQTSTYPHLLPNEDLGHLQWYADLRRWGTAPHGGFGLGFDRFMGYLSGVSSVRDIVAFPRYFGRAEC